VFCVWCCDHAFGEPLAVTGSEVVDGLLELWTGVVDLWPGFWGSEGELVGRDADCGAILGMDGGDTLVEVTAGMMV